MYVGTHFICHFLLLQLFFFFLTNTLLTYFCKFNNPDFETHCLLRVPTKYVLASIHTYIEKKSIDYRG